MQGHLQQPAADTGAEAECEPFANNEPPGRPSKAKQTIPSRVDYDYGPNLPPACHLHLVSYKYPVESRSRDSAVITACHDPLIVLQSRTAVLHYLGIVLVCHFNAGIVVWQGSALMKGHRLTAQQLPLLGPIETKDVRSKGKRPAVKGVKPSLPR